MSAPMESNKNGRLGRPVPDSLAGYLVFLDNGGFALEPVKVPSSKRAEQTKAQRDALLRKAAEQAKPFAVCSRPYGKAADRWFLKPCGLPCGAGSPPLVEAYYRSDMNCVLDRCRDAVAAWLKSSVFLTK